METQTVLSIMLGVCVAALIGLMTRSKIAQWISRACLSAMMIMVMNCLLPQYVIGFNLCTIGFSTVLGMPGLMTLYLLKMII